MPSILVWRRTTNSVPVTENPHGIQRVRELRKVESTIAWNHDVFSFIIKGSFNALLKNFRLFLFLHSHHGWEGICFKWKMTFEIFIKSLRFETPWVRKNVFYESVCLPVCLSAYLSFVFLETNFMKRFKIPMLVFDSAHKSLQKRTLTRTLETFQKLIFKIFW